VAFRELAFEKFLGQNFLEGKIELNFKLVWLPLNAPYLYFHLEKSQQNLKKSNPI
jgi:hypothetical protein